MGVEFVLHFSMIGRLKKKYQIRVENDFIHFLHFADFHVQ